MLDVESLRKEFITDGGVVRAVDGVSFNVEKGRAFTLLGASGCGKTTTLRCIAGLERPTGGVIRIGGREVFNAATGLFVPPDQRRIGMVFQSYAIWPHMDVFENVAFPLRIAKKSRRAIEEGVKRALDMVQMGALIRRPATRLSGGQQQRLAMARALVQEPDLLLLDEPLSNLDAKLREQMRVELKTLQQRLGLTMLYVTHDQTEAIVLSDEIAVMRDGRIVQHGGPREIYARPKSRFVADFVGSTNFIDGKVAAPIGAGLYRVETALGPMAAIGTVELAIGDAVVVSVRPESVTLTSQGRAGGEDGTVWEVTVANQIFVGESTYYEVTRNDRIIRVRANPQLEIEEGRKVFAEMNAKDCVCVPEGG
jgi:iron(III) transport system ATP-binding protein